MKMLRKINAEATRLAADRQRMASEISGKYTLLQQSYYQVSAERDRAVRMRHAAISDNEALAAFANQLNGDKDDLAEQLKRMR